MVNLDDIDTANCNSHYIDSERIAYVRGSSEASLYIIKSWKIKSEMPTVMSLKRN